MHREQESLQGKLVNGEEEGRREDRTEAASGAFGGGVFAEDTGKRES